MKEFQTNLSRSSQITKKITNKSGELKTPLQGENMGLLEQAIETYSEQIKWQPDTLQNALQIFTKIKDNERLGGKELENAKRDLDILGVDYKGLTKNQLYLKHQSEVVNRIYLILREEYR